MMKLGDLAEGLAIYGQPVNGLDPACGAGGFSDVWRWGVGSFAYVVAVAGSLCWPALDLMCVLLAHCLKTLSTAVLANYLTKTGSGYRSPKCQAIHLGCDSAKHLSLC